jgi:hypothetical protein
MRFGHLAANECRESHRLTLGFDARFRTNRSNHEPVTGHPPSDAALAVPAMLDQGLDPLIEVLMGVA